MAVVLALGAALAYGSADFMGGMAARRASVLAVALGAQIAGLGLLVVALPLLGPASVSAADVAFGAGAGLFGGAGVVLLLGCLARGPMSIVAPTTALAATAVPVLAGILGGDRPGATTLAGIAVALMAVVLITRESNEGPTRASLGVVAPALGAGAVFGMFFVFLHGASGDAGLWPLLAARAVSVPTLALLVIRRRVSVDWRGSGVARSVFLCGVLDMAANVAYLLALRHGMLAVVATITGLYPASTVMLAQTRLDERLERSQLLGLGAAALAAAMVAA